MLPTWSRRALFFSLLLGLTAWSPAASAKAFAPSGQGFSINMPGKPTTTETTHKSFVGAVLETSYTVLSAGATYTASVSNLPGAAVALGGPGTILGKAKDGLLKESRGKETAFENTTLGSYEGRILSYSLPSGGVGKAHMFLVEKRLYVLVGSGPAAALSAIERFLNSFKLGS